MTEEITAPREGFDAASPYELCERYAAGYITRDSLIDRLTRWEYEPGREQEPWNEIPANPPGTFDEVIEAADEGLITDEMYDEVLARRAERIGA